MFNFEEKFIDNGKLKNYRLLVLYGENIEQKQFIVAKLKNYFINYNELDKKEINKDNSLLETILLSKSIFNDEEIFIINDANNHDSANYLKIFTKHISITKNFFILIVEDELKSQVNSDLILYINCKNLSENERFHFIKKRMDEYKIKIDNEEMQLLVEKFANEKILSIDNELKKLKFAHGLDDKISNKDVEELLSLEPKTEINKLSVAIIYKSSDIFTLITKLNQEYSPNFVIRIMYNFFLNLSKTFIFMKKNKCDFNTAIRKHFYNSSDFCNDKFKSAVRTYNFRKISKILQLIVECEINIKKKPSESMKFFIGLIGGFNKI